MAEKYFITFLLLVTNFMFISMANTNPFPCPLPPDLTPRIHFDPVAIDAASSDYGNIVHDKPLAVLYPTSVDDIVKLVQTSYNCPKPFSISVRGNGHSTRGQDMALNGVVIDMKSLRDSSPRKIGVTWPKKASPYVEVGGETLWSSILNATFGEGLAPVSWTDFLDLSVGGTLSNAGISGQTFNVGPQISNVFEMDVVTGKGELVTCSAINNPDLFYGVLGGLGQFGIITRARIASGPAPERVKWTRVLYTDFNSFSQDQEKLIQEKEWDYVEGALLLDNGTPNTWRTDFFPPEDLPKILSLVKQHGIVYCIELSKGISPTNFKQLDKKLRNSIRKLNFELGLEFSKEVSYVDFLKRVPIPDVVQAHPWLNLFIPKSGIIDFNSGVLRDIVLKRNITTGPVIFYPMNGDKWDNRVSTAIPDEGIFYTLGLLYASELNAYQVYDDQNQAILDYCDKARIRVKQYLGYHPTQRSWIANFGWKWASFFRKKARYDPKKILSPGQRIFNNN